MEFPTQVGFAQKGTNIIAADKYDMRDDLVPRRLTMAMWDQAFLLRHVPGGAFEDFDKVLDETIERGYNTVRLDPMPQLINLDRPEQVHVWPEAHVPYMPWYTNKGMEGPVCRWLIEFMEKLLSRDLYYTLSSWWYSDLAFGPKPSRTPSNHVEAAEIYSDFLRLWEKRFGFDRLVYVDIANEVPYFLPGYLNLLKEKVGLDWGAAAEFTAEQAEFIKSDINSALAGLRRMFPQLRFICSIHADTRWLKAGVEFDCLDVHFWADADPRWLQRTCFHDMIKPGSFINEWPMFCDPSQYADFSDRCKKTYTAVRPMLRARQRQKLAEFSNWARLNGMPLTTSESWASWFYIDHPDLDWGWLLSWAQESVEDAIDFGMWGWTPHNYVQPQFENWKNVHWHQQLTRRFLAS